MAAYIILAFVVVQRLAELVLARSNTRRLLRQGAVERGAAHYPFMVALHAAWLAGLFWLAPGRPVSAVLLALYVVLQGMRLWVIRTLGPRWTTRIIVLPGAPLVRNGPYLVFAHPNYVVVALEIAVLPLMFGLTAYALVFSLLNAMVLFVRIRAEDEALDAAEASR